MGTTLKCITVLLTEEQHEGLRRLASEKRNSMVHLVRDAVLEMLEDEEDIRVGLKVLQDEEGTMTLQQYQQGRP